MWGSTHILITQCSQPAQPRTGRWEQQISPVNPVLAAALPGWGSHYEVSGDGWAGCDGMPGPVKTIICFIAATFTLSISYNVAFITGLAGGLMASFLIYSGFWWSSVSFSLSNRSLLLGWNLMLALERARSQCSHSSCKNTASELVSRGYSVKRDGDPVTMQRQCCNYAPHGPLSCQYPPLIFYQPLTSLLLERSCFQDQDKIYIQSIHDIITSNIPHSWQLTCEFSIPNWTEEAEDCWMVPNSNSLCRSLCLG